MIHRARINYVRWRAMARLSGASTQRVMNEPIRIPVRKQDVVRATASMMPYDLGVGRAGVAFHGRMCTVSSLPCVELGEWI